MHEIDVDAQIKNYWNKFKELDTNEERIRIWEFDRYGGSTTDFYNPDDEKPMRLTLFLSFLDTAEIEDVMKTFYKRLKSIKYLKSMALTIVFKKIKGLSDDGVSNYLKTHSADAELLHYEQRPDGSFKIPDGETIRYNVKIRFGSEGIKKIDKAVLVTICKLGKQLGIDFGDCCGSDAFPVESVNSDENAEYNGHYKKAGYKIATTESYGIETGIVPLVGTVIGINDDEGKELIPHTQELKKCDIAVKNNYVDGKYSTVENIAQAEVIEGTKLHYDIAMNWVYNHNATPDEIQKEYQLFHSDPDFRIDASLDYMMEFLIRRGHYETVGYMLRNEHIAIYEECPDGYLDEFHRRNICESENNYIKNDIGLQKAIRRKGEAYIELQLHLTLLALHVIALVRLQNGIKKNLVSTRGLT